MAGCLRGKISETTEFCRGLNEFSLPRRATTTVDFLGLTFISHSKLETSSDLGEKQAKQNREQK